MKPMRCVTMLFCLGATAGPLTGQEQATADADFEQPGPVEAARFVPTRWMRGDLHYAHPQAWHNGLQITYRLITNSGETRVMGTQSLISRIHEIQAIARLRQMSKGKEFGKALAKAGEAKLDSAAELLADPIGTVKKLPQGAARFFGRIGESMKGGRSKGETPMAGNVLGVRKKKAELALQLGVSAYSSNQELQHELNQTARAMAAGALLVNVAGMTLDGGAAAALSVIGVNQTLQETLINSTPEDLQAADRAHLLKLGAPPALAEEFLMNPWFSPWQEATVAESLKDIGINPAQYVAVARTAQTEEDARYFVQVARLFQKHHESIAPLKQFRIEHGILCALDERGTLVVAVSLDYAIWSEHLAGRADAFAALASESGPIRSVKLAVDGLVSAKASRELMQRGIVASSFTLGSWQ